jgi:hypothetical protein
MKDLLVRSSEAVACQIGGITLCLWPSIAVPALLMKTAKPLNLPLSTVSRDQIVHHNGVGQTKANLDKHQISR